jgi:tRNA-specific 2-thiouridylase
MKTKVIIGMSGGIDSSVAALFLKKQGYEVIGITLKHLPDELSESGGKTCCSIDDITDAKNVCGHLGIPHYTFDVSEEFKTEVMDYFIKMYNAGKTPSPCVICDEKIKMKKLLEIADKMGAKYIATGHYSGKTPESRLIWDRLNSKDQTYMLYRLDKKVLERTLFPLSGYDKKEIRKIAKEEGIKIHSKPDSQGICFAPQGYEEFLKSRKEIEIKEGLFKDKKGNILGKHKGYQLFTVGQRRGLGINLGKVYFITDIIPDENLIILGEFEDLQRNTVKVVNFKFNTDLENIKGKEITARPRFSSKGLTGEILVRDKEVYFIFDMENAENAEGQHIVFYLDNVLIGGGEIEFQDDLQKTANL